MWFLRISEESQGTEQYIKLIEQNLLPEIGEKLRNSAMYFAIAERLRWSNRSAFCRRPAVGLEPRMHAEQLSRTGAARLALLMRAQVAIIWTVEQERHCRAGKIGNRGDAAAGLQFSSWPQAICSGAGAH